MAGEFDPTAEANKIIDLAQKSINQEGDAHTVERQLLKEIADLQASHPGGVSAVEVSLKQQSKGNVSFEHDPKDGHVTQINIKGHGLFSFSDGAMVHGSDSNVHETIHVDQRTVERMDWKMWYASTRDPGGEAARSRLINLQDDPP